MEDNEKINKQTTELYTKNVEGNTPHLTINFHSLLDLLDIGWRVTVGEEDNNASNNI